jgi:phage tail-like protein
VRGTVDGLLTPHPLGRALPGLYQGDELAQRFLGAFDDVLAPVFCALDNFDAYLDPRLAPSDFLEWLATWVGVALDGGAAPERRRTLVAEAVELYRWRGTARGLSRAVALVTGVEPEVEETGTAGWSPIPTADGTGAVAPSVRVILRVPDPATIDRAQVDAIVEATKPAHVTHQVEVVAR